MWTTRLTPQMDRGDSGRTLAILVALALLVGAVMRGQAQTKPSGEEPTPQPAIPAILAAFDKYEVVGISAEPHDFKDADDFILSLIRSPEFPAKVNDIAVECGNSLYQPLLDRYIAGEDVSFTEVQKVWRDTTQPMCSFSGFFEEFFPLVRTINQKLLLDKRLRVLAGDPPIDWSTVKSVGDAAKDRDGNIASVMEKEVFSKHRKALMLFGLDHLFHGGRVGLTGENAAAIFEKDYPGKTFVIGSLALFDLKANGSAAKPFEKWPYPSLTQVRGTWLGALDITHFYLPVVTSDKDCDPYFVYPNSDEKAVSASVDAFLYFGPGDLSLTEPIPADILLDSTFMAEMFRRETLIGFPVPKTFQQWEQQQVGDASQPIRKQMSLAEMQSYLPFARQACLEHQNQSKSGQ